MDEKKLRKYIVTENHTVIEAMRQLDFGGQGILFVTDENDKLCGSLTDGDIRRWIIKTADLSGHVSQMMNRNPKYLFEGDVTDEAKLLKKYCIRSLPILDSSYKIKDIHFEEDAIAKLTIEEDMLSGTPVIIMAGGKGTRLYPYTKILPKPLIPIGDIPILERILNRFYQAGIGEFFLTVNYKKEMIKSYFAELKPPYKISYTEEDMPLGTAGGIRLINKKFTSPTIVTNCDILIDTDYKKLIEYHENSRNDMTIVSALKNIVVPYGVLHSKEGGIITSIEEKPQLSYIINTGMYVINPEAFELIPEGRFFHMTDLADKMIKSGMKVGIYPITENSFSDMGQFEEMRRMEERFGRGSSE